MKPFALQLPERVVTLGEGISGFGFGSDGDFFFYTQKPVCMVVIISGDMAVCDGTCKKMFCSLLNRRFLK